MLVVDVGTNAEITLGSQERVLSCSSPTGPAFEGRRSVPGSGPHPARSSACESIPKPLSRNSG